jgi:hypothetical protein
MQCYETEALRLQLYADTRAVLPDVAFDPLSLDEVLDESGISRMQAYMALEPGRRAELARRAGQLAPRRRSSTRQRVA